MARILLLEPSVLLAKQYQAVLTKAGHTVDWCQSGQQAIQAADAAMPDVVVLELLLPRHSGVEFLYELRSYTEWQNVPVVVLSSMPETEIGKKGTNLAGLGIARYLYKSDTNLDTLVRAVGRLLEPATAETSKPVS